MSDATNRRVERVKMAHAVETNSKQVVFEIAAEPGSSVFVAGTFNKWDATVNPLLDKRNEGVYRTTLQLAPGYYEYKFVINDIWSIDPECRNWTSNAQGSLNSVIVVE